MILGGGRQLARSTQTQGNHVKLCKEKSVHKMSLDFIFIYFVHWLIIFHQLLLTK